jgi:hypothetical protein
MSRLHVFADEAGCFTFERKPRVSTYFILCTVTMDDCAVGNDLLELRRNLAWKGADLGEYFHASEDKQAIRNEVFGVIQNHNFKIQATIMEKSKAQPHICADRPKFYQYGWFYLFKHGVSRQIAKDIDMLVTAATIGTRRERAAFQGSINDVLAQLMAKNKWKTDFCPAAADPCVQVADYCAWAIQRKWEMNDLRSYDLIKDKISYEYELWGHGTKHYY